MAEREKYYIGLNGQTFEVSRELYEAYYKGRRKEKYFTHDLKQEHTKVDKETGEMMSFPAEKIPMSGFWRQRSSLQRKRRMWRKRQPGPLC